MQRRNVCSGRCSISWAKTILPSYMARPPGDYGKHEPSRHARRVQVDDSRKNGITASKSIASAIVPITDSGHYWDKPRYDHAIWMSGREHWMATFTVQQGKRYRATITLG